MRGYGTGGLSKVTKSSTRRLANGETTTFSYDYWCASWSTTNARGRRVWVRGYGRSEQEAQARLRQNMAKRVEGGGLLQPTLTPRLKKYMETWLETVGADHQNETSKLRNRRNLEQHVLPYLNEHLHLITSADVQRLFFTTLPNARVTPSSRYNAYASLRALLNYAVKFEVIKVNPCLKVEVKKPKPAVRENDDTYVGKRLAISKGLLRWLQQPDCPHHALYARVALMFLGLRRAELLGVEWKHVKNLEKKGRAYIHVCQQLMGPETKKGWHIEHRTKNGEVRDVPLPDSMRLALLAEKRKQKKAQEEWASDLVFLTPRGRWVDYNTHAKDWDTVLTAYVNKSRSEPRELDETEYFRPHAARRLCVTLLAEQGVPLETAKEILGHRSIRMTEYYHSVTKRQKREAASAIEAALDAPKGEG